MKSSSIPNSTSKLSLWLDYLKYLHVKTIDLSLDRVNNIANKLDLLNLNSFIITVSGTNGKGTTCCLLETILLASNKRVGVYSSPHLINYTERIRIQGKTLSDKAHIKAMSAIESARGTVTLSYFEFSTLTALYLFRQKKLDFIILEVGLGGRLDATNIIDTDMAIITNIAIDHIDYLGADLNKIAYEKAGIFRYGKPAIIGDPNRPIIIDYEAKKIGAHVYICNRDWWWYITDMHYWSWRDNKLVLNNLPLPFIPIENAAIAIAAARLLPFPIKKSIIKKGLQHAKLPGRFQCINHKPLIILDVAHNPHAANYLSRRLETLSIIGKIRAVVAMLANKDIDGTISNLSKKVSFWYCASFNEPKAAKSINLMSRSDDCVQYFNTVQTAWYKAIADSKPEDCILVFGSFYTVSIVMKLLLIKRNMNYSINLNKL